MEKKLVFKYCDKTFHKAYARSINYLRFFVQLYTVC